MASINEPPSWFTSAQRYSPAPMSSLYSAAPQTQQLQTQSSARQTIIDQLTPDKMANQSQRIEQNAGEIISSYAAREADIRRKFAAFPTMMSRELDKLTAEKANTLARARTQQQTADTSANQSQANWQAQFNLQKEQFDARRQDEKEAREAAMNERSAQALNSGIFSPSNFAARRQAANARSNPNQNAYQNANSNASFNRNTLGTQRTAGNYTGWNPPGGSGSLSSRPSIFSDDENYGPSSSDTAWNARENLINRLGTTASTWKGREGLINTIQTPKPFSWKTPSNWNPVTDWGNV